MLKLQDKVAIITGASGRRHGRQRVHGGHAMAVDGEILAG
jgi:hypothetical protein